MQIEVRGGDALQDWNVTNWRRIKTSYSCGAVVVVDSSQQEEATVGRGREIEGDGGRRWRQAGERGLLLENEGC